MSLAHSEDRKPRAWSLTGLVAVVALLVAAAALLVATTRDDPAPSGPGATASHPRSSPVTVAVPVLLSQPLDTARAELALAGFGVATAYLPSLTIPQGDIIAESPMGGTAIPAKAIVTVTVSSGPPAAGQKGPVVTPPVVTVAPATTSPAGR